MKKVCFIAQFPPPIHGLSKAVETAYSALQERFSLEAVNITSNKAILKNLMKIIRSRADLFYFTPSQSKGGNLRDILIMGLLRMQGKRCVVHLHGGYYRTLVEQDVPAWQRRINHRLVRGLAGAIVLGDALRDNFTGLLPDEKIHIVHNCVDDEYMMSDEEFAGKLDELPRRQITHVLYLSNMMRIKGYPVVLEMARHEKEACEAGHPRCFHFDFAGHFFDDEARRHYQEYVCEHDLEEYVTYHGVVSGDDKRRLLRESDVFVLPTTHPTEGQPISILEAMGNGLAVLTTDYPGIADIVQDGENGAVVDRRRVDAGECYARLNDLVTEEMLRRNRDKIKSEYNQTQYVEGIARCFLTVCGESSDK